MPFSEIDTVLFDLDGTLLDSVPGIVSSFEATLVEFEVKNPPSRGEIVASLGRPLAKQMQVFSDHDDKADAMVQYYIDHNRKIIPTMNLFEHAQTVVQQLKDRGLKVGVVTAKYKTSAYISFDQYNFPDMMDVLVTGSDTTKHKPDPEPLHFALEQLGKTVSSAVYIGDATHDILAAKAAGCRSIAALWGPNHRDVLLEHNPTAACESILEIADIDFQ